MLRKIVMAVAAVAIALSAMAATAAPANAGFRIPLGDIEGI